jgi:hypothetical protein
MKKRISLAVMVLFASISFAIAQGGGGRNMDPAERAKSTVERLKPELTLNEQQEKDITPIYAEFYTSLKKIMDSGTRPTAEERQKLLTERNDKLQKVLSEDQMKKLAELEEKMRQERRQNGGGGGGNN